MNDKCCNNCYAKLDCPLLMDDRSFPRLHPYWNISYHYCNVYTPATVKPGRIEPLDFNGFTTDRDLFDKINEIAAELNRRGE